MSKGRTSWIKPHHKPVQNFLYAVFAPYVRRKYHITVTPYRDPQDRPLLILMNHQTGFDQFFPYMAFKRPLYFVASEDIFSCGWLSDIIRFLAAPIPIKKQTSDLRAVRTALQIAKEGGSIALAPEGNRTFDGKLCHINPAILGLIRLLKMPVACFRIEGGFGIHPRWSDVIRKGNMKAYVSRVIEPEEYRRASDEELMQMLLDGIGVDETQTEGQYHSHKLAEYVERAIYVCPDCGLSTFESHGDLIECKTCGRKVRYLPDKSLQAADGRVLAFHKLSDWYEYQNDYICRLDLTPYYDTPAYEDFGKLSEVILYQHKKVLAKNAHLKLYGNRIEVSSRDFTVCWHFDDTDTITVLGKNKLNIYTGGKVYQIKPDKRFNALRYVNFFYHYKSISKGENDGKQFLGL